MLVSSKALRVHFDLCTLTSSRYNVGTKYQEIHVKARLNGFNICPTFVQQKVNGCWANGE